MESQLLLVRPDLSLPSPSLVNNEVDNTNADIEVRSAWIALAKKHNVPIRCVLFKAPQKLCEHNDAVRALNEHVSPAVISFVSNRKGRADVLYSR